ERETQILTQEKDQCIRAMDECLQQEALRGTSYWDTACKIAEYATAIGMILMGASTKGSAGTLLSLAGGVGIACQVEKDTRVLSLALSWLTHSQHMQQKISERILLGAFFLQVGLGIVGGVGLALEKTNLLTQSSLWRFSQTRNATQIAHNGL